MYWVYYYAQFWVSMVGFGKYPSWILGDYCITFMGESTKPVGPIQLLG